MFKFSKISNYNFHVCVTARSRKRREGDIAKQAAKTKEEREERLD